MNTETNISTTWNKSYLIKFFKYKFYISYGRVIDFKRKELKR